MTDFTKPPFTVTAAQAEWQAKRNREFAEKLNKPRPGDFILHPHQAAMLDALRTGTGAFTVGVDPGAPEGDRTAILITEHVTPFADRARSHRFSSEDGLATFICPRCGAKSYNASDIEHRYCGRCKVFVDEEIRRDLREGGLPLAERVDGFIDEAAAITPDQWKRLSAPVMSPEQIRASAQRVQELWWANHQREVETQMHLQHIRRSHDPERVQAYLDTLVRFRADATRHPGKLQIDAFWLWREACLRSRRDAHLVGMARGGFYPSPVRWICVTWCEPEPRRSRMLGLPAPWGFGGAEVSQNHTQSTI